MIYFYITFYVFMTLGITEPAPGSNPLLADGDMILLKIEKSGNRISTTDNQTTSFIIPNNDYSETNGITSYTYKKNDDFDQHYDGICSDLQEIVVSVADTEGNLYSDVPEFYFIVEIESELNK